MVPFERTDLGTIRGRSPGYVEVGIKKTLRGGDATWDRLCGPSCLLPVKGGRSRVPAVGPAGGGAARAGPSCFLPVKGGRSRAPARVG